MTTCHVDRGLEVFRSGFQGKILKIGRELKGGKLDLPHKFILLNYRVRPL